MTDSTFPGFDSGLQGRGNYTHTPPKNPKVNSAILKLSVQWTAQFDQYRDNTRCLVGVYTITRDARRIVLKDEIRRLWLLRTIGSVQYVVREPTDLLSGLGVLLHQSHHPVYINPYFFFSMWFSMRVTESLISFNC